MAQSGKYEIIRRLATGGMAEVFLAKAAGPMGFEKELVVKRILPHLAEDPQFVEMFLTEAKLAARLNHGNVVQIFDFGEQDDSYFIAMEYIDGLNLKALLKKATQQGTPIPYPLVARIISLACEGLAYAHELMDPQSGMPLGFIHRDISTDNILVSLTGGVKVADFGIAKAANMGQQTQGGVLKGKLAYMPPEYLRGMPIDSRADIYALGVVLYELIAGRKPFVAESDVLLAQLIVHGTPTDIRTLRMDIPAALVQVIERALDKNRDARYASCRQMQADLDRFVFQGGRPVGALQIAEWVKSLAAIDGSPLHNNPQEASTIVSNTTPSPLDATRSLKPSSAKIAAHSLDDTVIAPSPSLGSDEEDKELMRLVTRSRWPKALVIAAGVFILGAAAIPLFSLSSAPIPSPTPVAITSPPSPSAEKESPSPEPSEDRHEQDLQGQTEKPPTEAPLADLTAATATRLRVEVKLLNQGRTSKLPASLRINDRDVGSTPWERALSPGQKKIEISGSLDGHRFNRSESVQLAVGQSRVVTITIQRARVQVWGQPKDMMVLELDGHPLDKGGWVETLEGRHTLKVVQKSTGKLIPAECQTRVISKECKVILNP